MTSLHIVLGTAGILGLMYAVLSMAVTRQRFKYRVSLGDGGDDAAKASLRLAVRIHGNFAEYAPFALILLAGIAWAGATPSKIGWLAGAFILGRLLHMVGMHFPSPNPMRAGGMVLTWAVLIAGSVQAILLAA